MKCFVYTLTKNTVFRWELNTYNNIFTYLRAAFSTQSATKDYPPTFICRFHLGLVCSGLWLLYFAFFINSFALAVLFAEYLSCLLPSACFL